MLDQLDSSGKGISIAVEVSSSLDYENITLMYCWSKCHKRIKIQSLKKYRQYNNSVLSEMCKTKSYIFYDEILLPE